MDILELVLLIIIMWLEIRTHVILIKMTKILKELRYRCIEKK